MQQTSPVNKFIIADFKDPLNFSIKDTLYEKIGPENLQD